MKALLAEGISGMNVQDQQPPRKRRRAALSCENCRQKKLKCDRNEPCEACIKSHMETCIYRDGKRLSMKPAVLGGESTYSLQRSPVIADSDAVLQRGLSPYQGPPTSIPPLQQRRPSPGIIDTPVSLDRFVRGAAAPLAVPGTEDALSSEQMARQKVAKYQRDGFGSLHPDIGGDIHGSFSKGNYYGESHWISYLYKCPSVTTVFKCFSSQDVGEFSDLLVKCKVLSHDLKMLENRQFDSSTVDIDPLPSREVMDPLLESYMRTFHTILPIVDAPSFWTEYADLWLDKSSARQQFLVQLKLVLAIGSSTTCENAIDRFTICRWIRNTETWLGCSQNKWRATLDGLRIRCLMLNARQAHGVDARTSGLNAGATYQMAMQLGLHIDPQHLQKAITAGAEAEARRKLWATLMELELQATMDAGSTPLIHDTDWDCTPPGNLAGDLQSSNGVTGTLGTPLPIKHYTSSSLQNLLARSLPLRVRITRFVNSFRAGSRYQEALVLSSLLVDELRYTGRILEGYRKAGAPVASFQIEMFHLLMHRSVLALHYSSAIRARTDPTFYYSRKICLDSALVVLTPGSSAHDTDFTRLMLHGKGVYEDVYTQALTFLCDEVCIGPADSFTPASETIERRYLDLIRSIVGRTLARLDTGASNIKGYGLFACLLAYCEATLAGEDVQSRVRAANRQALETGHAALQLRYDKMAPAIGTGEDQHQPDTVTDNQTTGGMEWFQWDDNFDPDADNWLEDLIGLTS